MKKLCFTPSKTKEGESVIKGYAMHINDKNVLGSNVQK